MNLKFKWKSDCNGRPLNIGDRVRVCAMPNLVGMMQEGLAESKPIFRYAVGKNFIINSFDEYGCAGLDFSIPVGSNKGWHGIYVETYLLKKLVRQT